MWQVHDQFFIAFTKAFGFGDGEVEMVASGEVEQLLLKGGEDEVHFGAELKWLFGRGGFLKFLDTVFSDCMKRVGDFDDLFHRDVFEFGVKEKELEKSPLSVPRNIQWTQPCGK